MTNAEKFEQLFGLYVTELWSKHEKDFLTWLNMEYADVPDINVGELISRRAAIDAVEKESQVDGAYGYMDTKSIVDLLEDLPSTEPDIDEFLRNKSPKEHREILHWIAIHYYPRDSKEVLQAVSTMIRPDMRGEDE